MVLAATAGMAVYVVTAVVDTSISMLMSVISTSLCQTGDGDVTITACPRAKDAFGVVDCSSRLLIDLLMLAIVSLIFTLESDTLKSIFCPNSGLKEL